MKSTPDLTRIFEIILFLSVMFGFLYFSFIGNPFSTTGVVWDRTIFNMNHTYCTSVGATPDGGYMLIGSSNARRPNRKSAYVVKTDSTGKVLWERRLGEEHNIKNVFGLVTETRELVIAGYWRSKVYVAKTNLSGDIIWERVIEKNSWTRVFSLTEVPSGGYAVVGYADHDVYLLKLDEFGEVEWERLLGEGHGKQGHSIQPTKDGGFIIAGECDLTGIGVDDVYLLKTDSQGYFEWQMSFGGNDNDHGRAIHVLEDGYVIAGSRINNREIEHEAYLLKTDLNGKLIWEKTYSKAQPVLVYDMQVTPNGSYLITGVVFGSDELPHSQILVLKTDSEGTLIWDKILSTQASDFGACIILKDDSYIVAGNRDHNIFILKIRD